MLSWIVDGPRVLLTRQGLIVRAWEPAGPQRGSDNGGFAYSSGDNETMIRGVVVFAGLGV